MKVVRKPMKAPPGFRLDLTPRMSITLKKQDLLIRLDEEWFRVGHFFRLIGVRREEIFARLFTRERYACDGETVRWVTGEGAFATAPESLIGRTAASDIFDDSSGLVYAEPGGVISHDANLLSVRGDFFLLDEGEAKKWPWLVTSIAYYFEYEFREPPEENGPWGLELGPDGREELNELLGTARTEPFLTEDDVYELLRRCCEDAAGG